MLFASRYALRFATSVAGAVTFIVGHSNFGSSLLQAVIVIAAINIKLHILFIRIVFRLQFKATSNLIKEAAKII
jgi:hypothetical protein